MSTARVRVLILFLLALLTRAASAAVLQDVDPPQDLQVQTDDGHVFITWRAGGETPPDGFRLEAGSAPGVADLAIVNIPWGPGRGLQASFAASGVAPGVYYVRVRAVYGRLFGAASEEVVMRVEGASCPLPNAPRNIAATVDGERVTLTWEPPAEGARATGYVIEAGTRPGAPDTAIIQIAELTMFSAFAPAGQYYVRLRTMGQCGGSEPSREMVVVVP